MGYVFRIIKWLKIIDIYLPEYLGNFQDAEYFPRKICILISYTYKKVGNCSILFYQNEFRLCSNLLPEIDHNMGYISRISGSK